MNTFPKCYTEGVKKQYPKEVIEALDGSIEKWFNITFKGATNHSADDCPLCQMFLGQGIRCKGCPINEFAGGAKCNNTPYGAFISAGTSVVISRESAEAAYNFYKWLCDLRDKVEVEKEEYYRVGDMFRCNVYYPGGIYMLLSDELCKVGLYRLNGCDRGTRMASLQKVAATNRISENDLRRISNTPLSELTRITENYKMEFENEPR